MADKSTPSSLARYLDGEFWETKDHIREEISQGEPFRTSRFVISYWWFYPTFLSYVDHHDLILW